MAYFRFLPDIQYISPFESRQSNDEYVLAKNLFKRIKISDDGSGAAFLFNKYVIQEGERPDTVSAKVYGNSNYDWLVIVGAGIINQRDEWPLSSQELYEFSLNKYGNDLTAIKHYRTTEVKVLIVVLFYQQVKLLNKTLLFQIQIIHYQLLIL